MATIITSECINCGACEPECPNTAIYAGGAPWELNGESHPALSEDIYYITPQKCTECVGFYDHEACAAVCPVDCCIPDPNNLETEAVLLARARALHPEETIPDDAPSRFRKPEAAPPAVAPDGAVAAKPAEQAGPTAPPPVKPAAAPAAPKPAPSAAAAAAPAAAPKPAPPAAAAPAAAPKPAPPAAPKPAPSPAAAPAPSAALSDEFNPMTWEVPVICKDCNQRFAVPYRHFQAGVVFYCPSCSGSFVPKSTMARTIRETFEAFYDRRRAEREAFERRRQRDREAFQARQTAEMDAFKKSLDQVAQERKPAGKMVRPKGLASMFT